MSLFGTYVPEGESRHLPRFGTTTLPHVYVGVEGLLWSPSLSRFVS